MVMMGAAQTHAGVFACPANDEVLYMVDEFNVGEGGWIHLVVLTVWLTEVSMGEM